MPYRSLSVVLVFILGCSRAGGAPPPAQDDSTAPSSPSPSTSTSTSSDEAGSPDAPPKHYRVVVHTGDSMVGGGLCKGLAPKFKDDGTKFVRDVWEAASLQMFAASDRLPKLMARYDPDLVLLTLGANDMYATNSEYFAKSVEKIVKKVGNRDCVWIGPPSLKGRGALVDVLREHSAPCRFYDSSSLDLARRPDGIHPTDKGGEVWADAVWDFVKSGEPGT